MDNKRDGVAAGNGSAFVRSALADHFKRVGGLLPITLMAVLAVEWLPRAPKGHAEPVPMFITGAILVILSTSLMRFWRPSGLFGKWALRWALGFGVLLCATAPLAA